jgi:hypothetical protein
VSAQAAEQPATAANVDVPPPVAAAAAELLPERSGSFRKRGKKGNSTPRAGSQQQQQQQHSAPQNSSPPARDDSVVAAAATMPAEVAAAEPVAQEPPAQAVAPLTAAELSPERSASFRKRNRKGATTPRGNGAAAVKPEPAAAEAPFTRTTDPPAVSTQPAARSPVMAPLVSESEDRPFVADASMTLEVSLNFDDPEMADDGGSPTAAGPTGSKRRNRRKSKSGTPRAGAGPAAAQTMGDGASSVPADVVPLTLETSAASGSFEAPAGDGGTGSPRNAVASTPRSGRRKGGHGSFRRNK